MHAKIDQINVNSILPGYLFIMTSIADIGETVLLNCPLKEYEFVSSMLSLVGVRASCLIDEKEKQNKTLIILDDFERIDNIILTTNIFHCPIIYVKGRSFNNCIKKKIEQILLKYPQHIIINNTEQNIDIKYFTVYINKLNSYYNKIRSNIYVSEI